MAYPTKQKTWTIGANNVITYVSLVLTTGEYMKGMADFLLANGYACKGSCDGVTGAMDAVNRWTTVALASIRGANATTANSWMVLTDANGCDICLSFVGGTDDVARFSFSPTGVYVAAGTATFTPTATDEAILNSTNTVIATNTSGDRVWHGWVDSQSKMCRFVICRNGVMVGIAWGVELVNVRTTRAFSPAVWGFSYLAAQFVMNNSISGFTTAYVANSRGGIARIANTNVKCGGGVLTFLQNNTGWGDVDIDLQGGAGAAMFGPLSIGSADASFQGPVAYLYDWWTARNSVNTGDTYDSKNFVQWTGTSPAWPWDGSTTPNSGTGGSSTNRTGVALANEPEISYGTPQSGELVNPDSKVYTTSQVLGGLGI